MNMNGSEVAAYAQISPGNDPIVEDLSVAMQEAGWKVQTKKSKQRKSKGRRSANKQTTQTDTGVDATNNQLQKQGGKNQDDAATLTLNNVFSPCYTYSDAFLQES